MPQSTAKRGNEALQHLPLQQQQQRQRLQALTTNQTTASPKPSAFQTRMDELKWTEIRKLNDSFSKFNAWMNDKLESVNESISSEPSPYPFGQSESTVLQRQNNSEYVRVMKQINFRYDYSTLYFGAVMGMGSNEDSQLSVKPDSDDNSNKLPDLILMPQEMRMVSAGALHSLALSTNGVPYTWGCDDKGALGRITINDVQAGQPLPVTGFNTTFTNQATMCEDGQIRQIAAGESHSLFLSVNGNVYQCGMYRDKESNEYSDDDSRIVHKDIQKKEVCVRGVNKKPVHVHQLQQKAAAIYSGGWMNAALLIDETLVTWGMGVCGELARSAAMTHADEKGTYDLTNLYGEGKTSLESLQVIQEYFLKPKPVIYANEPFMRRKVIDVACGDSHIVVVARDPDSLHGKLYTSGLNNYGQLGHNDVYVNRHALTLVEAVKHYNFVSVAAGGFFSLALTHDCERLFSFGRADSGQLGIGLSESVLEIGSFKKTPQLIKFRKRVRIESISAGATHAFALTTEDELYSWGFNEEGQTGHPYPTALRPADVYGPTLLNLDVTLSECHCRPLQTSGGAQHSLLLVQRDSNKPIAHTAHTNI